MNNMEDGPAPRLRLRSVVSEEDVANVRAIVASTGFFSASEIEVAAELVQERLAKGENSGYAFVFAELDGVCVGYACFGRIPCTARSFDLYWIAVRAERQGQGLGRRLLGAAEEAIGQAGGGRVYVETSSQSRYAPTRAFYEAQGYRREAVFEDFYAAGDAKVVYLKVLD